MVHAGVFIVTLVPPTVRRTAERFPSGGGLIKLLYRGPSHLLSHQGSHSLNQAAVDYLAMLYLAAHDEEAANREIEQKKVAGTGKCSRSDLPDLA